MAKEQVKARIGEAAAEKQNKYTTGNSAFLMDRAICKAVAGPLGWQIVSGVMSPGNAMTSFAGVGGNGVGE